MNPHTATLTELREWLAKEDGWRYETGPIWQWRKYNADGDMIRSLHPVSSDHPFPPTLDGAASAMPEGCLVECSRSYWWEEDMTAGQARVERTKDEITDRYRLAALCVQAEKENKHGN